MSSVTKGLYTDPNDPTLLHIYIHSLFKNDPDSLITKINVKNVIPVYNGYFERHITIRELKKLHFEYLLNKKLIDIVNDDDTCLSEGVATKINKLLELFLEHYVLVNSTSKNNDVSTKLFGNRKFTIRSRAQQVKFSKRVNRNDITAILQRVVDNGTVLSDDMPLESIPSDTYCKIDLHEQNQFLTIYAISKHCLVNKSQSIDTMDDKNVPNELYNKKTLMHIESTNNTPPKVTTSSNSDTVIDQNFSLNKDKYFKVSGTDNLLKLNDVSQSVIEQTLASRFQNNLIYTDFGPILISINPFRYLPVYNPRYMKQYSNNSRILPPHIFSVAGKVYEKILTTRTNQCIVISGVSGSGKTECAKFLIQQLLYMANSERESYIESITNAAIQILETFGNAVTESNDNASRFGLVTEFKYSKFGQLKETQFSHYLLEKSRIIKQSINDRNYHIFYYLECGLKISPIEHEYLVDTDCLFNYLSNETIEYKTGMNMHRTFKFKILQRCFNTLGLEDMECEIYKILIAILFTGNININPTDKDYAERLKNDEALTKVANLLQIKKDDLIGFLSMENITIKKERMNVKLTPEQAIYTRDGLAKSLYVFVFDWLVGQINHLLACPYLPIQDNIRSILLLDIFGFENYKINRFEQFCINYANEAIQNYMITSALQQEQEMYISEGIVMEAADYSDSLKVLQMIAGKPVSINSIIVEESLLSVGSATKMRQKINDQYRSNPKYIQTNNPITISISHYAGPVIYDLNDFRTKNLERNFSTVTKLISHSVNKKIKNIILNFNAQKQWNKLRCFIDAYFQFTKFKCSQLPCNQTTSIVKKLVNRSSSRVNEFSEDEHLQTVGSTLHGIYGRGSSKLTVLSLFQESLNKLLNILNDGESSFVYCIRSNTTKQEFVLDPSYFSIQLEYSGIFKGLTLLTNKFQNVFDFNEFTDQFQLFIINSNDTIRCIEDLNDVFNHYQFDSSTYFVGKTKVFVMDSARKKIVEICLNMYTYYVECIELWWSTYSVTKKFRKICKNILLLQKFCRILIIRNQRKPTNRTSYMIDVDNIDVNSQLTRSIEKLNISRNRLTLILTKNEPCKPKLEQTFKQLIYTEGEVDEKFLQANSNQNITDNSNDANKVYSNTIEDVFVDEPSNPHIIPHVRIEFNDSKSCIIDVDTLDHESDILDDNLQRCRSHEKIDDDTCDIEDHLLLSEKLNKHNNQSGTLSKSFRSILNYKRKTKSKSKSKHDKPIFVSTFTNYKKKKSVKTSKYDNMFNKENFVPPMCATSPKTSDIIVDDHESFYIFIKYIQKYAFANQTTPSFNNGPTDDLLSVFFTSLQRFTSINHAIFVNAFRFAEPIHMTVDDAVKSFDDILTKTIVEQQSEFPINMGKNSFLGLLKLYKNATKNELHQLKKDFKRIRDSFDLNKSNITNEGHMMNCSNPLPGTNFCEVCNTLVWSDAYTCDYCQVVCHKRCIVKLSVMCTVYADSCNNNKFYQIELYSLVPNQNSIPDKLLCLLQEVEKRCLNIEGIYRRQCNMEKINNGRNILDNHPCQDIDFGQFEPLVLSSLIKLFFRQLPTPLFARIISLELTNAGDINNENEALYRINQILLKISKLNYLVLERILAHLAAITENEQVNKMTSFNLAVIFAPCLFDFETTANITQLKFIDHQRRVIQLLIDTLGKKPPSDISYIIDVVDTSSI